MAPAFVAASRFGTCALAAFTCAIRSAVAIRKLHGTSSRMMPSCLLSRNIWPSGPSQKRRSTRSARRLALRGLLFVDDLEKVFRRALVIQENPVNRILSTHWQVVSTDVEDLTAGVVTEEQQVRQLRNFRASVDETSDGCRVRLKQRIELAVLNDRICDLGILAPVRQFDATRSPCNELEAPSQIFQPRLAPALTGLISSTVFCPISDMNMLRFFGSQKRR